MSIPDHATYFVEEVERIRNDQHARMTGSYDDHRVRLIHTLAHVPSVESVRALGELLSDDRDRPPPPRPDREGIGTSANNVLAARSLGILIESPPIQKNPYSYNERDLHPWVLWYEQVKAGTRTFRFKDDPQEYSLAGPVDRAKEPVTTRPEKPKEIDASAAAEASDKSGVPWPILLAALAVCGAGVWFVLNSPRSAAG